ncbi:MAG: exodeoxyribonuclease VII small subunit [bacterium]
MEEEKKSITESLSRLESMIAWFEVQKEVDVEAGLEKVKEGAALIKELKQRLKRVENEFQEIKKEVENEEERTIIE